MIQHWLWNFVDDFANSKKTNTNDSIDLFEKSIYALKSNHSSLKSLIGFGRFLKGEYCFIKFQHIVWWFSQWLRFIGLLDWKLSFLLFFRLFLGFCPIFWGWFKVKVILRCKRFISTFSKNRFLHKLIDFSFFSTIPQIISSTTYSFLCFNLILRILKIRLKLSCKGLNMLRFLWIMFKPLYTMMFGKNLRLRKIWWNLQRIWYGFISFDNWSKLFLVHDIFCPFSIVSSKTNHKVVNVK